MNSELELLAARKQMLVARITLQRLQATQHVEALRESLRWPGPLLEVATRGRGRAIVVAVVLFLLARRRISTAARWASVALGVLQLVRGLSRKG